MSLTIQNGEYIASVLENTLAESANGTPSVKLHFELLHNVNTPQIKANGSIYADLWLSDACFERTLHTLTKVLGWAGTNLSELADNNVLLEGARCLLVIENETYKDKIYPKVKFVNEIKTGINGEKAKNIADKLKDKVLAYKQKSPDVRRFEIPQDPEQTQVPPDDDLPF